MPSIEEIERLGAARADLGERGAMLAALRGESNKLDELLDAILYCSASSK